MNSMAGSVNGRGRMYRVKISDQIEIKILKMIPYNTENFYDVGITGKRRIRKQMQISKVFAGFRKLHWS